MLPPTALHTPPLDFQPDALFYIVSDWYSTYSKSIKHSQKFHIEPRQVPSGRTIGSKIFSQKDKTPSAWPVTDRPDGAFGLKMLTFLPTGNSYGVI